MLLGNVGPKISDSSVELTPDNAPDPMAEVLELIPMLLTWYCRLEI